MKHILTAVAILAASSTMASAHDKYTCDRTNLSAQGFVDRNAAESWFPKRTIITIADDKSWMHSIWGTEWKRNKNDRKFDIETFNSNGTGISVRIFKNNTMTASILSTTGIKHTTPSYYKCAKSTTSLAPSKDY